MSTHSGLLACAFAIVSVSAAAQSPADRFAGGAQLVEQGDAIAGLGEAREAYLDLWQRSPLILRVAELVEEPAATLGLNVPKQPPVYGPGEPMYLYLEPVGFGWTEADDQVRIAFGVDVSINTSDGSTMFAKDDFTSISVASGERMTEFFANITYTFTGLPAGDYTVVTTLNDVATSKSVKASLGFTIAE